MLNLFRRRRPAAPVDAPPPRVQRPDPSVYGPSDAIERALALLSEHTSFVLALPNDERPSGVTVLEYGSRATVRGLAYGLGEELFEEGDPSET